MTQKKVDSLYTGYVIFTKKNCGNDFLSKVGDGTVGLDVYDIKAMYSADGIYYRDAGDSTSSAVFQFTKTKNGKKLSLLYLIQDSLIPDYCLIPDYLILSLKWP